MKKWILRIFLATSLAISVNFADENDNADLDDIKTYELEATEITAAYEVDATPERSVITSEEIKRSGAQNLGQAIKRTPGVYYREPSGGGNSPSIYIRGYSNAQIGVYVDGIPMNSIYGGSADYSMFATSGLSGVEVAKSFADPSLGAGTLGGSINMLSARPENELEVLISSQYIGNDGNKGKETRYDVSVGTKQQKFYFKIDYANANKDTYSFSKDYNSGWDNGRGYEFNGYYKTQTLKMKLGWTHNINNEYSLNYILTKGSKGGMTSNAQSYEQGGGSSVDKHANTFSDYPVLDTQTIYMLGTTYLTPNLVLDSKLFYQNFGDTETGRYRETGVLHNAISDSNYNDETYGTMLDFIYHIAEKSKLSFGINAKYSEHNKFSAMQKTLVEPYEYDFETRATAGEIVGDVFAQYSQGFGDFRLILGASYDIAATTKARIYYNYGSTQGYMDRQITAKGNVAWQGVLYYDFLQGHSLHLNVGQKYRLPTLRQRYSGESAEYAPNPDLKPESAINYEIGYDLSLPSTAVSFAVFYNDLKNMFDSTGRFFNEDTGLCPSPQIQNGVKGCYQIGNLSGGYSYGGEIAVEQGFFKDNALLIGASYSYIAKYAKNNANENRADEQKAGNKITDYSNHIVQGKIAIKPIKDLEITGYATYESAPYIARVSVPNTGTVTMDSYSYWYDRLASNEYVNFDLMARYVVGYGFSINAGVYNLTDRDNYIVTTGAWTDMKNGFTEKPIIKRHLSGRRYVMGFEWRY